MQPKDPAMRPTEQDRAAEILGRLMHARPRSKLTLPPAEQKRIHRRSGYDLINALEREGYVVVQEDTLRGIGEGI